MSIRKRYFVRVFKRNGKTLRQITGVPGISQTLRSEDTVHKTALTSDTNSVSGFPKPPSGSIVYQKDSQNSLNAIMLMAVVYRQQST